MASTLVKYEVKKVYHKCNLFKAISSYGISGATLWYMYKGTVLLTTLKYDSPCPGDSELRNLVILWIQHLSIPRTYCDIAFII
jgi:hypothetical protein